MQTCRQLDGLAIPCPKSDAFDHSLRPHANNASLRAEPETISFESERWISSPLGPKHDLYGTDYAIVLYGTDYAIVPMHDIQEAVSINCVLYHRYVAEHLRWR